MLVTSGPTHEPIDEVRYIANRSSGRTGAAIADEAVRSGWTVTLLLGPSALMPSDPRITAYRFRTTDDLARLLAEHWPTHDVLVAAAAVADFRPRRGSGRPGKLPRMPEGLTLELESTPDLLAECARNRRPGQVIVGFALEEPEQILDAARRKLARKGIDAIVANPLGTMEAETIHAAFIWRSGDTMQVVETGGPVAKAEFARWLLARIEEVVRARS